MIHPSALSALDHVRRLSDGPPLDRALRITLHFHPDIPFADTTVLGAIAGTGRYRSQFETGTSNGGLTAHPGGDRWRWEERIFGVFPQTPKEQTTPIEQRPKYGSLNVRSDRYGGSPRFGSSHLRLTGSVLDRATFAFPDSAFEPTSFGTAERMGVLDTYRAAVVADPLDDYIEAHVHGIVAVPADVEALVLDPSFRGTAIEGEAAALGCPVEWHDGFRADARDILRRPDYRGRRIAELAATIAVDGILTPRILGDARRTPGMHAQDLKRIWHCIARFGRIG